MSTYIGEICIPFREDFQIELGVREDNIGSDSMRRIANAITEMAAGTLSCVRRVAADNMNPSAVDDATEGAELLLALSIALRNGADLLDEDRTKTAAAAG